MKGLVVRARELHGGRGRTAGGNFTRTGCAISPFYGCAVKPKDASKLIVAGAYVLLDVWALKG